jgi:hypothetical protein
LEKKKVEENEEVIRGDLCVVQWVGLEVQCLSLVDIWNVMRACLSNKIWDCVRFW